MGVAVSVTESITVSYPAAQGLPGASAKIVTHMAGIDLGGHRATVMDTGGHLVYADSATPTHAQIVLGITTGAASGGTTATVQTQGEMTEPSWAWTPGAAIYLGTNGQLTQTVPTSGFALSLGFAITATQIFIHIGFPIILS